MSGQKRYGFPFSQRVLRCGRSAPPWLVEGEAVTVHLDPGLVRQAVSLMHAVEPPITTGLERW